MGREIGSIESRRETPSEMAMKRHWRPWHLVEWTKVRLQRIDWLYQAVMRWKSRRVPSLLVRRDRTKLVIEAYPRSSNSFGVRMFRHANPDLTYEEVSHHSHIVSNVKQAVKWNIPVLVIVREPVDAITSNMIAHGDTSDSMLRILTTKYLDFYGWCLENKDAMVIAAFEDVTEGRFRRISERLNERFGTSFSTDFDEKELMEDVKKTIKEGSPNKENPSRIPIPSREREAMYEELRPHVRSSSVIQSASRLYEKILADAIES